MAAASSAFLEAHDVSKESLQLLRDMITVLENHLVTMSLPSNGLIKPGEYIFELFEVAGIISDNYTLVKEVLKK